MRQAGRYLPEYRRLRERYGLMELCRHPELAAEVTLMPVRRFAVDAAIIFADLMTPLEAMNIPFEVQEGIGPTLPEPFRSPDAVQKLSVPDGDAIAPFTMQAIRIVKRELKGLPLIGFAGAPFTLACYLIEGGPSRDFAQTRSFMFRYPNAFHQLMAKLTEMVIRYITAQVQAGADAVQIFDSWVGCLSKADYRQFVLPHMNFLFERTASLKVPRILFGTQTATLLPLMRQVGSEVIGLDWRVPLDEAWQTLDFAVAVQGNLDPAVLLADWQLIAQRTLEILRQAEGRAGHIFNLGHGLLPQTNPSVVARLVDFVHETTLRSAKQP